MKQSNKIFTIIKEPGRTTEIRLIDKNLKNFNIIIDGKKEVIPFPVLPGICIIFDGAGQAAKKANCYLPEYEDILTGTVIFAGIDLETGFMSLTEEQTEKLEEYTKSNDAKGLSGNLSERIRKDYLPHSDENYVYEILSEVKTKYKTLKVGWLNKR